MSVVGFIHFIYLLISTSAGHRATDPPPTPTHPSLPRSLGVQRNVPAARSLSTLLRRSWGRERWASLGKDFPRKHTAGNDSVQMKWASESTWKRKATAEGWSSSVAISVTDGFVSVDWLSHSGNPTDVATQDEVHRVKKLHINPAEYGSQSVSIQ